VDSCKWTRLTNPTVLYPTYGCSGDQSEAIIDTASHDTTPQARHTYAGTCYIQHVDKFFMVSRGYVRTFMDSALHPDSITWIFDPATRRWENRYPVSDIGTIPKRSVGDLSVYDSVTRKVYYHGYSDGGASMPGWFKYDYEANTWTRINQDDGSQAAGCLDSKRRLIVEVGNSEKLTVWDIDNGFAGSNWTTARAGNALNNWCDYNCTRGVDYDKANDRYVVWYETSDTVFVLDPVTKVWDTYYAPQSAGSTNGIYNRFRYVPTKGAFMAAAATDHDVIFFKLNLPLHQDSSVMLSLDPHAPSFTLEQYQSLPLLYTASFADGKTDTVTWNCFFYSLDTAIASVTQEGVVYGKHPGQARIRARKITRQTTLDDTVTLTVVPTTAAIDSIRLDTALVHVLNQRDTFKLTGTVYAHGGSGPFTWTLDTSAVWVSRNAGVNVNKGIITGVSVGGPVAVVVSQGGRSDSCMVTVLPNPAYIKRINCQNPALPVPFGWVPQGYDWLYSSSRGYGWVNYPDDNNRVMVGTNFLTQTRMISYAGCSFQIDVPAGDYIIKAGLGDINPYYFGWNWLAFGTDTLMKWYDQTGVAGVGVDTVTVTGTGGLVVRFKGFLCYIIIISKEGIDINTVAEDGGLVPNIGTAIETAALHNLAISLSAQPNPFMPSTSISFTVPPGLEGSFRIFSVNGAVVKSCQALKGKSSIRWDGKDASGRALASGLYVGKLELSNGKSLRHNLLLLR
jgi:hypothetical protein